MSNLANITDPNTLFEALIKESHQAHAGMSGSDDTDTDTDTGTNKIANDTGVEFDLAFFDKIASGDTEAGEQLSSFVTQALDKGHSAEEIEKFIADLQAQVRKTASGDDASASAPAAADGAGEEAAPPPADEGADAFEAAVAEAQSDAMEQAIADRLEHNPLAKAAGIDREALESFLIGEEAGIAYFQGAQAVDEQIEKIASRVLPDDDLITEAVKMLKEAGLDVTATEAELAELEKQAGAEETPVTSEAAKKARELAEAEMAVVESLTVLKCAGFDVEALMKQAEEKKKMSAGKKALIAGGTLAGLAGGGLLLKRHSGTLATKAVGAMNAAKDKTEPMRNKIHNYRLARQANKMKPGKLS